MQPQVLDGAPDYAVASRFQAGGSDSIDAAVEKHHAALKFKIDAGWSPRLAKAHTLISASGITALARALRDGDSVYAASTHAICRALASRAREMTPASGEVAPLSFANLHGRFGLASEDTTWGHKLTPNAKVGTHFTTHGIVCATANASCFADSSGFGVPMLQRDLSTGELALIFKPQDSPVVCFVSRATSAPRPMEDERVSAWGSRKSKGRRTGASATGHSLIHSSGSTYEVRLLALPLLYHACHVHVL